MAEINRVAGTQLDADLAAVFTTISKDEMHTASRNLFAMESGALPYRSGTQQPAAPL